jgi:hypothetical protein
MNRSTTHGRSTISTPADSRSGASSGTAPSALGGTKSGGDEASARSRQNLAFRLAATLA